ncbi:hypothetical protein R1sor_006867 [Riccia sorocarpa]|uniref:Reverse transcriptase zinc-binding domain-containing protein n=1 Tax=Riccia sorocarpa TaxID=122646 RepID=A0ABD3HQY3_9MARC
MRERGGAGIQRSNGAAGGENQDPGLGVTEAQKAQEKEANGGFVEVRTRKSNSGGRSVQSNPTGAVPVQNLFNALAGDEEAEAEEEVLPVQGGAVGDKEAREVEKKNEVESFNEKEICTKSWEERLREATEHTKDQLNELTKEDGHAEAIQRIKSMVGDVDLQLKEAKSFIEDGEWKEKGDKEQDKEAVSENPFKSKFSVIDTVECFELGHTVNFTGAPQEGEGRDPKKKEGKQLNWGEPSNWKERGREVRVADKRRALEVIDFKGVRRAARQDSIEGFDEGDSRERKEREEGATHPEQRRRHVDSYFKMSGADLLDPTVKQRVREAWGNEMEMVRDDRRKWARGWCRVKRVLREIRDEKEKEKKAMGLLQQEIEWRKQRLEEEHSEEEVEALLRVKKKAKEQALQEAREWRTRSRAKWLSEDEAPSKYFFAKLRAKWARESIKVLELSNGEVTEDDQEILQEIQEFYQELYSAEPETEDRRAAREEVVGLINSRLTVEESSKMSRQPDPTEIKGVVFGMAANKAPGIDGLTADVLKCCWDFVGEDCVKLILCIWAKKRVLKADCQGVINIKAKLTLQDPGSLPASLPVNSLKLVWGAMGMEANGLCSRLEGYAKRQKIGNLRMLQGSDGYIDLAKLQGNLLNEEDPIEAEVQMYSWLVSVKVKERDLSSVSGWTWPSNKVVGQSWQQPVAEWRAIVEKKKFTSKKLSKWWNIVHDPMEWGKRWNRLWKGKSLLKHKLWIWKLLNFGLCTHDKAERWGVSDGQCTLCLREKEDVDHLTWACSRIRDRVEWIADVMEHNGVRPEGIEDNVKAVWRRLKGEQADLIRQKDEAFILRLKERINVQACRRSAVEAVIWEAGGERDERAESEVGCETGQSDLPSSSSSSDSEHTSSSESWSDFSSKD